MLNLVNCFRRKYRRLLLYMLLMVTGLLLPIISTPALADSPVIQGTILAGSLSNTISSSYSTAGTIGSTATLNMPFSVRDLTGSGNGWSLMITSTQFTNTDSGSTSTLPKTASVITSITAVCTETGTCSGNTLANGMTLPIVVPAATTAPAAVKFFGAAVNTGMGVYTVTPSTSITIPTGTLVGTYSTTITVTISSGP